MRNFINNANLNRSKIYNRIYINATIGQRQLLPGEEFDPPPARENYEKVINGLWAVTDPLPEGLVLRVPTLTNSG